MIAKIFGSKDSKDELQTVAAVDVQKYMGVWYEIASVPSRQQRRCVGSKAKYTLTDKGYVAVRNSCIRDGKEIGVNAKAFPVPNTGNAKLKVQFFWPIKVDYWVIELAADYSYAVVSQPSKKRLWVISRTPELPEEIVKAALKRAEAKGIDTSKVKKTSQPDAKSGE